MDPRLQAEIAAHARESGLQVSESFYRRLDEYTSTHFPHRSARDKLVIQTYLARGGLQIARTERKNIVEAEDAKAAIWLFHLPEQPDDPCIAAGERALAEEGKRPSHNRGILTEGFAKFLRENP